jgi:hypothetical protein
VRRDPRWQDPREIIGQIPGPVGLVGTTGHSSMALPNVSTEKPGTSAGVLPATMA